MSKISKIEAQKNNSLRVNIYIDHEYAMSCHLETLLKYNISEGAEADSVKLRALLEEDNYLKCKNYALRIIEKGPKSEAEMLDRLKKKGYDEDISLRTLEFLKEYSFVDDEKLTGSYIRQRLKSEGTNKIKALLYRKGIPEDIVKSSLCLIDEKMEEETALNLACKKYNILVRTESDNKKLYKKIGDYLMRRGYSYDVCKRVLKKVLEEWDNQDY